MKKALLALEGLFRLLRANCERNDEALIQAIADCVSTYDNRDAYLDACTDAAIFCKGNPPKKGASRGSADGDDAERGADEQQAPTKWHIYTAQAVSKAGVSLMKELLLPTTITYLIEWCESPDARKPGVAYDNVSVVYDRGGENVKLVASHPDNSIYLKIPYPLTDAVLESAGRDLASFISQTFWANREVYECMQAAQALALRGENIDRCFMGWSPGGVGQSLYSMFLANMYGSLHVYFDPNIWYHDDELRKQVEC